MFKATTLALLALTFAPALSMAATELNCRSASRGLDVAVPADTTTSGALLTGSVTIKRGSRTLLSVGASDLADYSNDNGQLSLSTENAAGEKTFSLALTKSEEGAWSGNVVYAHTLIGLHCSEKQVATPLATVVEKDAFEATSEAAAQ